MKKIEFILNEVGCHICTSHYLNKDGYPKLKRNNKDYLMGRYLWEEKYGPIPEKICICHHCDNPSCINLEHLFLGSHTENMNDRNQKNRAIGLKGENNNSNKLTKEQVLQIRQETGTQKEIAKKYNVSQVHVGRIKNKKLWV